MKPRVVVSACLGFEACRYDGACLPDRFLPALAPHANLVRVCPEVEIGLGTPRDPIRIELVGKRRLLVQPTTGRDLTGSMERYAARRLAALPDVDGFVLKSRSPSCGVRDAKRYGRGRGKKPVRVGRGPGLFAEAVRAHFPSVPHEDEGRLTNLRVREHFLTCIFTTAAFRAVRRQRTRAALVAFHGENELLFSAANQTRMRAMGRIVANAERLPLPTVLDAYEAQLHALLARTPRVPSQVQVAEHARGLVEDRLTAAEKRRFKRVLDTYHVGRAPLAAVRTLLASWAARFSETALSAQTWFAPFPAELSDADRG